MRSELFLASILLAACVTEPDSKPPPVPGGTGQASLTGQGGTSSGTGTQSTTEVGTQTTSMTPACDPLGDPTAECGPGQACSFVDLQCHPSNGLGPLGAPCEITDPTLLLDTCGAPLVCAFVESGAGRCVQPCDANETCGDGSVCVDGIGPLPGLCLQQCDGLAQLCDAVGDGCYPVLDVEAAQAAVCLPAGTAALEDPCEAASDCAPGLACTDAAFHASRCGGEPLCCAELCDAMLGVCLGIDSVCAGYDIASSPGLGVCVDPESGTGGSTGG